MTVTGAALGPVADYLPHRPPMLLIDDLVEWSELRAVCRTVIRPDCVFAIDGAVHPAAMIEFVAQVCAIYVGVRSADKARVERFTRELAPLILNGPPSVTGFAGGRPKVEEIVAYWPALVPKKEIRPEVRIVSA